MQTINRGVRGLTLSVALLCLAAAPLVAEAQRSPRGGGGGGGQGQGPSGGGSGGGGHRQGPSGGGSGGDRGRAVPRGTVGGGGDTSGGGGRTAARPATRATAGDEGSSQSDRRRPSSGGEQAGSRPRGDRPAVGEATERQGSRPGRPVIIPRGGGGYYGGYYPWGYGGLGLAGFSGGFYDPWWYGGGWDHGGYGYGYGGGYGYPAYGRRDDWGRVRIKVKPRDAEVFVDGYFAGRVDDFDGVFQRLHVDPGPHRFEIRAEGYQPLMFELLIQPDRSMTYEGELKEP